MRSMALGSIRTRVDRLASAWATSRKTVFVCMEQWYERCRACAYDLKAHARAAVWAEALKGRDPREGPPAFVHVLPEKLTCPRCGAPLPS